MTTILQTLVAGILSFAPTPAQPTCVPAWTDPVDRPSLAEPDYVHPRLPGQAEDDVQICWYL